MAWSLGRCGVRHCLLVFPKPFLFVSRGMRSGVASGANALRPSPVGSGNVVGSTACSPGTVLTGVCHSLVHHGCFVFPAARPEGIDDIAAQPWRLGVRLL